VPSLTRAAARERAASIRVDAYEIDLDLTRAAADRLTPADGLAPAERGSRRERGRFGSVSTITFRATEPGLTTFVDVRPVLLRSATLNGVPLDTTTLRDGRLPLPNLAERNVLVVEADMAYTNTGQGLHRFTDPADGRDYVYAVTFLDQAPTVFACFDQPDLKAPFSVRVRTDPEWIVAGNGVATQTAPGEWTLATTPPLATYFVTVIAGPYHAIRAEHDGIPLALYARVSLAGPLTDQAPEMFAVTRACLDRYHELFGVRYPFGAYQQAFVPEFTMGAMENPGCVTFRDDYVFTSAVTEAERENRALVIAHEMAHMWFGDLVTMRWWDDLWLNESFADYLAHRVAAEVTAFRDVWTTFTIERKAWGYAADQRPSTHPVSGDVANTDEARRNVDGISYAKGAAVLRQLVALLGDDVFFAGLRELFATYAYGNATLEDLLDALSSASGRDLHEWARAWLRTVGVSTLRLVVAYDNAGAYAEVDVVQSSKHGMRPHRIRIGAYSTDRQRRRTIRREVVDVDIDPDRDNDTTKIRALTGRPATGLLLPNDDDLTYAKIRLDPNDLDRLADVVPTVGDPLARALLWSAAWDVTRDAEWDAERFLALCAAGLPAETNVAIFDSILGHARDFAVARYMPPDAVDSARRGLAAACRASVDAAVGEPGRRLAAARGLIACAGPEDTDWLNGWRSGGSVPPDLTMDSELRWLILIQLATLGAANESDIADEYAREQTAIAAEHAATARAARPDPQVKAAAWHTLINDDSLSNRLLFATARGFFRAGQAAQTIQYVERYVLDMPAMAARRSAQVADRVATLAFPAYAVDPGTLAAMTRLRDDESLVPGLRRVLIDETDELARSVAARDLVAQLHRARAQERGRR
jgi:aminopeptidase N